MRWKYEYVKNFHSCIENFQQNHLKIKLKEKLFEIHSLDHPKDIGGRYFNFWCYQFCGKHLIQCDIDENNFTVTFINIIL